MRIEELLDALEDDYRVRKVRSLPQILSHLKSIRAAFGDWRAVELTAEEVDRYIQRAREAGSADASINRGTQLLRQAFRLAVERQKLSSAPNTRHLSEKGNARQGFFERADFEAVVSYLPEYLRDFAWLGYCSG